MVKCYSKQKLKKLQVYKLKAIAKQWGIKRLKQMRKNKLIEIIFTDPNNKNLCNWINEDNILQPVSLKNAQEKQSKKRKKLRRKKAKRKTNRKLKNFTRNENEKLVCFALNMF